MVSYNTQRDEETNGGVGGDHPLFPVSRTNLLPPPSPILSHRSLFAYPTYPKPSLQELGTVARLLWACSVSRANASRHQQYGGMQLDMQSIQRRAQCGWTQTSQRTGAWKARRRSGVTLVAAPAACCCSSSTSSSCCCYCSSFSCFSSSSSSSPSSCFVVERCRPHCNSQPRHVRYHQAGVILF